MSEWKDFREELLRDPEVRKAYDARAPLRDLAHAIMEQRLAKKITQKELAEKMSIPQGNVSRLESGAQVPTISMLHRAAKALGVPFEIRLGNQVIPIHKE